MKPKTSTENGEPGHCAEADPVTRLLVLPDGRVLAHNLTTAMAEILQLLAPNDKPLRVRSRRGKRRLPPTSSTLSKPVPGTP